MTAELAVKVHEIAQDGLPDMEALTGHVAFIFDGCIVSGWPLRPDDPDVQHAYQRVGVDPQEMILWEANSDVGHSRLFGNVEHWVEFPVAIHEVGK